MIYIDFLGVFVAALSGALVAARKEMDVFGFLVLGVVTGVGGGTLRDLLIGAPVFWIEEQLYLLDGILAALVAYIFARQAMNGWRRRFILWLDAAAMAFFAASGAMKAIQYDATGLIVVMMGFLTAVAGGLMRDTMAQEQPFIFGGEIYATAAIIGAVVVWLVASLTGQMTLGIICGAASAFSVRSFAIVFDWRLRIKSSE